MKSEEFRFEEERSQGNVTALFHSVKFTQIHADLHVHSIMSLNFLLLTESLAMDVHVVDV